jgi:hypothetical protein
MAKLNVEQCIKIFKNWSQASAQAKDRVRRTMRAVHLLTEDLASAKLLKSAKFSDQKLKTYILYLSPADIAFKALGQRGTVCPLASAGCKAMCLNTAGRGRFDSVANARLRKTMHLIFNKADFIAQLAREIKRLEVKCKAKGLKLCIRLNGTSDLPWHLYKLETGLNLFQTFPDVQFYDYTKVPLYLERAKAHKNWYLTFSASETNEAEVLKALAAGINVAVPYFEVPAMAYGRETINGDEHDLRFLDKRGGYVVALKAKGKAKKDTSGFVRQCGAQTKAA